MNEQTGIQRVADVFNRAHAEQRAAVMPYLTLGYPTPDRSLSLVEAAVAGGADLLELGIPFSDPLADGPTVQRATQVALREGMTVQRCMKMAATLRERGITVPFVFMGYYNPILAYGEKAFCFGCRDVGVDGLIVPDLPPGEEDVIPSAFEGGRLAEGCRERGLAHVHLLAPTSPDDRLRVVTQRSRGFVYLVSVTGVTGARDRLPADLTAFVQRVRPKTDKPLAVGFGISTPGQAAQVAALADGVIVGSALLQHAAGPDGTDKVRAFVASLRQATMRDC
jgi:tryptophan synthase alpha chain